MLLQEYLSSGKSLLVHSQNFEVEPMYPSILYLCAYFRHGRLTSPTSAPVI